MHLFGPQLRIMITTSNSSFDEEEQDATINYSMFDRTPSPVPGCPACEPNLLHC